MRDRAGNGDRRYFIGKASSDVPHLITAVRYVERNPVRARLVERATDWPWSSARAHANGEPRRKSADSNPIRQLMNCYSWNKVGLNRKTI
jgi:hypothetical protein